MINLNPKTELQRGAKMGDISKKTLAILLLVAIVLSAVATWKILSSEQIIVGVAPEKTQGNSYVSFNIGEEQAPAEPVSKTGQVSINIE